MDPPYTGLSKLLRLRGKEERKYGVDSFRFFIEIIGYHISTIGTNECKQIEEFVELFF